MNKKDFDKTKEKKPMNCKMSETFNGMAMSQNTVSPPILGIPQTLQPLIEVFSVESEEVARDLIKQAAAAIYKDTRRDGYSSKFYQASDEEVASVLKLVKAINPKDYIETIYAAQIVACHMLGMRKLTEGYLDDIKLGLKILRLANDAADRLEKKRHGGYQNIIVTYNNAGPSMNAMVTPPTVIP